MANEAVIAAAAANRDVSKAEPGPFQDCRDVVHIAVFFDGTGNNRKADGEGKDENGKDIAAAESKKWSNVARMYEGAEDEPGKAVYKIYVSGIGTKYNGKAVNWLDSPNVWIEDNLKGLGFGGGGDRRLYQGDDNVNDRLRDALITNAKALGGQVSKYATENTTKSFQEVNAALSKHRLIKVINVSIFGFSRGAALARAFSNRIVNSCEPEGEVLLYQGYPLTIRFMGVFDTVASFGLPSVNVKLPFVEKDLTVPVQVERCVHYVAGNEVRFSFPVDLIRKDGKLIGNWVEKTYPGVHSDVGGGYAPKAQDIDNNYSRIPMRDMMTEAVTSGVRMMSYKTARETRFALFQKFFECRTDTETAYKNYVAACGPFTGTIEQQMKQHQKGLFSAYGTMNRAGTESVQQRRRRENFWARLGPSDMAREIEHYRAAAKLDEWVRISSKLHAYVQYVKPMQWQVDAWDTTAKDTTVEFVSMFVHDSKVDFLSNVVEPFSYFKPRGVSESTKSIWQEGGAWVNDAAHKVATSVEAGYKATEKEVVKAAQYTQKKVSEGADYTERKAKEGIEYAKRKEQEAEDLVKRKYKQGEKYVTKKADQVEKEAERLYDKGSHWVKSTKDEIVKDANEAATSAKKKANQVYDESAKVIDKAGKEVKKESNELYQSAKKFFGF